jgi:hypothetical protein
MAVITLPPKVYFESIDKLQLLRAGMNLRSRYTGKRQSINLPFAVWYLEGKLIPVDGVDARLWRSFLVKLEGFKNSFRLPVPGGNKPSGLVGVGAQAAAARATSFMLQGAPGNASILLEGEYFTINDELKVCTADCTTDGVGSAQLQFQPPLRKAVTAGTAIEIQNPYILFCAEGPDAATWSLSKPVRHGIKLICVEDI